VVGTLRRTGVTLMPSVLAKRGSGPQGVHPVQYTDESGRRRTVKGFPSRRESYNLGVKLEEQARRRRILGTDAVEEERYAREAARAIAEHVQDFSEYLRGQITEHERRQKIGRIERMIEAAGIKKIGDIRESSVGRAVALLRDRGLRSQTCKHYWAAMRQFALWLKRDGRARKSGFEGARLRGYDPKLDPGRPRRDMSIQELNRFFRYLETAPDQIWVKRKRRGSWRSISRRIPRLDRCMFYYVALVTGFRGKELRKLTSSSFRFESGGPVVVLAAHESKHRKRDDQVIHRDAAVYLKSYLQTKPDGQRLFAMFWRPCEILRADLDAAGIEYLNGNGEYLDVHSLRHTYITGLRRGMADYELLRRLARHSNIETTMRYAGHVQSDEMRRAVDQVPDLISKCAAPALHESGTNGRYVSQRDGKGNGHEVAQNRSDSSGNALLLREVEQRTRQDSNLQPSVPKTDALSN